jgi:hypothetical protein
MTQLAMLDEEKEDRQIPPAFVPQLRDYGLAGHSARNDPHCAKATAGKQDKGAEMLARLCGAQT